MSLRKYEKEISMFNGIKIMSPRGRAIYPKLNKPDTKWKAEGEYTVKLAVPEESVADFRAKAAALLEEFEETTRQRLADGDGKSKAKAKSLSVRPFLKDAEEMDDDGNPTGNVVLNFKMKASGVSKKTGKPWARKPLVFDAKGKKLDPCPDVWGGSILKVAGEMVPYYTPKDNEVGVSLRLEAVQIIELRSGSARDAGEFGFKEEDGYEDETSESQFSDETEAEGEDF